MSLLAVLLNFIKGFFVDVAVETLKTPAEETHVQESNGAAINPDADYYAGFNRVHDRDEAEQ